MKSTKTLPESSTLPSKVNNPSFSLNSPSISFVIGSEIIIIIGVGTILNVLPLTSFKTFSAFIIL